MKSETSRRTLQFVRETLSLPGGRYVCGMIQNLLGLSVPVHFLALPEASRRHHHGNCMSEARVDVAVRRLAITHALEPVVSVRFQIVALMKGSAFGLAGKRHR